MHCKLCSSSLTPNEIVKIRRDPNQSTKALDSIIYSFLYTECENVKKLSHLHHRSFMRELFARIIST